ncbi:MAG: tetratricopeptide repeat protein [Bdellovibrionales bacterium]|nr:tetratricopeptide repeat protein [Bdellovibrionales bacterium]
MSQREEALWLVKSGGRILGPYSKRKVSELLRTKEVVPLDEVCLPRKRWQYIRDHKEFSRVIEEIRIQQIKDASDHTETMGAQFDDMTASVTEALQSEFNDELTGDVEPVNDELTQDIPIKVLQQEMARDVSATGVVESGGNAKRFGTQAEAKKNIKSFSGYIWKFTFVTLAIVIALISANYLIIKPSNTKNKNQNALTIANGFYTNGKYKDALKFYKRAYSVNTDNKEPYVRYGTLLIAIDRETVEGKRILKESLNLDPANKIYVLTGIGLANLIDKDYTFAEKNFQEALNIDPNNTSSLINLGWLAERKGDYEQAIKHYGSAIIKGADRIDNSAHIYLSKALISKWKKSGNVKFLNEAKNNLLTIVDQKFDYRQEGLFLLSYIYSQLNRGEAFFDSLERMLDTDPKLTEDHAHDLNVYHDGISWRALFNMCEEIYQRHNQEASVVTMSGYCSLRADKLDIAENRFTELVNMRTKNPLLLAHQAFYLQNMERESAAAITLGKAVDENKKRKKYNLPIILEAQTCQEIGDIECAIEKWQELLSRDRNSIQAKSNIVILNTKKGNYKGMDAMAQDAKSISPNYAPAKYAETFLYDSKKR